MQRDKKLVTNHKTGDDAMSAAKSNDKTRVLITVVALIAVVILLVVIFVVSYRSKRGPKTISPSDTVSTTDTVSPTETESDSTTETAQTTEEATTTTTGYVIDTKKNVNEYIRNPDYKSNYYVVVYTLSQSVVTYKKDSNGGYTKLYKRLKCSTGVKDVTPTKEGVYCIVNKFRWFRLMGGVYGQYCCRFSEENGYYFHSVPYKSKDPSTMSNEAYDKLGRSASHGCIRLCARDAKWLYEHLPVGTQVSVVWEKGPFGLDIPARNTDPKYDGWDPTDQWSPGNPYFTVETTTTTAPTAASEDETKAEAVTPSTDATTAATSPEGGDGS